MYKKEKEKSDPIFYESGIRNALNTSLMNVLKIKISCNSKKYCCNNTFNLDIPIKSDFSSRLTKEN